MDDDYLPLEAYGVIGNNDRCALVGHNGSIDWCCFPHLESPSVFAAILDADDGGRFAIRPAEEYETTQTYVDRTNVLETTFETDGGSVTVTDVMPVSRDNAHDESVDDDSSTATDSEADRFQQAIYRAVEGNTGSVDLEIVFEPRFDYGRSTTDLERSDDGTVVAAEANETGNHSVNGDVTDENRPADEQRHRSDEQGQLSLRTETDLEFAIDEDETVATGTMTVEDGDQHWFHLQYGDPETTPEPDCEQCLEETISYWRHWLERCEESASDLFSLRDDWHDALVRSTLVLKLLIHDETGSIPAAATTSLPEEIGGELNWDYRYNWIRDAKFTIQALHNVGQSAEAHEYFEWFREIGHESPEDIRPLYGLHGETDLEEEHLEHLSGYRDSQPVRIGNAAADQVQLDMYGTVVQGIYETIRYQDGLSDYDWESVRALANHVCDHWEERGKGIWEFRDLEEHFVHSKLLCWVALDRAIRMGGEYDYDGPFKNGTANAKPSGRQSKSAATTRRKEVSCSFSVPRTHSMRRLSSSHSTTSCPPTTSASRTPSIRFSRRLQPTMASCSALPTAPHDRPNPAASCSVRAGSSTRSCSRIASRKRPKSSITCSSTPLRWDSFRR